MNIFYIIGVVVVIIFVASCALRGMATSESD